MDSTGVEYVWLAGAVAFVATLITVYSFRTASRHGRDPIIGLVPMVVAICAVIIGFLINYGRHRDQQDRRDVASMKQAVAGSQYTNFRYEALGTDDPAVTFIDEDGCWATIYFTRVDGVLRMDGPSVRKPWSSQPAGTKCSVRPEKP